jgi:chromate transporter
LTKENSIPSFIIFKAFLIASSFTFAGGLSMLPVLKIDFVDKQKAIDEEDFMHYAALSQTIPGIIAVNFGCLIGHKMAGRRGVIAAVIGSILPAFVLMLVATMIYVNIPQEGLLSYIFLGVRAASSSAVAVAGITMLNHLNRTTLNITLVILSLVAILVFKVSSPIVVLVAGLLGLFVLRGRI